MTLNCLLVNTITLITLIVVPCMGKERPLCPTVLEDDADLSAYIGNNEFNPRLQTNHSEAMSFAKFISWVRVNKVTSRIDFNDRFKKTGLLPDDVPLRPDLFYGVPWRIIVMIAGTLYKTIPEFLQWAKEVGIESQADFRERFGTTETRPSDVPSNPEYYYNISWSLITGKKLGRPRDPSKIRSRYYDPSLSKQ